MSRWVHVVFDVLMIALRGGSPIPMNLHFRIYLAAAALVAAVVGLSTLHQASPHAAAVITKPAVALATPSAAAARDAKNLALSVDQRADTINAYKKLPLSFEENTCFARTQLDRWQNCP